MATIETPTEVRAEARYVHAAPRKAQLIVSEIRGRTVPEARTILQFMTRAAARDVEGVLASAVANAEANHGFSGDDMIVSAAYVGSGPTLKRWRARARGRVGRIKKRTCHITIRLVPIEEAVATPPAPEPAPKRARRRKVDEPAPVAAATPETVEETAEVEESQAEVALEQPPPIEQPTPKPTRARRPKAPAPGETSDGEAAAAPQAGAEPPPAEEKPRRTRPRKKVEEPPAESPEGEV